MVLMKMLQENVNTQQQWNHNTRAVHVIVG